MRRIYSFFLAISFFASGCLFIALVPQKVYAAPEFHVTNYSLVGSKRVSRFEFDYEYQAEVVNLGSDALNLKATVTLNTPHATLLDGDLVFGDVAAGATVSSSDTFVVRQNRRYRLGANLFAFDFNFSSIPAAGVLLAGNGDEMALDALTDLPPVPVATSEIDNGLIMSRLDVVLAPSVDVTAVNVALSAIDAGIVFMRPQSPFITVAIPRQQTADDLKQLALTLQAEPAIAFANPSSEGALKVVPANAPPVHTGITRFPAIWNSIWDEGTETLSEAFCQGRKIPIVVADSFGPIGDLLPEYSRFSSQVPGVRFMGPRVGINGGLAGHGYDVTALIAARFDNVFPTGTAPLPGCLDILAVSLGGLSTFQMVDRIVDTFPVSGKFILNLSVGYVVDMGPLERALGALAWKHRILPHWHRFIVAQAAGNEHEDPLAKLFPGVGIAQYASFAAIAATADPFFSFLQDASLWEDQALNDIQKNDFNSIVSSSGLAMIEPLPNVLTVGGLSAASAFDDLLEADDSNRGSAVKAVTDGILSFPDYLALTPGTSWAAPQVAGLIADLWLASPALMERPIDETIHLIKTTSRANQHVSGIIDAYAALQAVDLKYGLPPTEVFWAADFHLSLLDIDRNDRFDESDLYSFLSEYYGFGYNDLSAPMIEPTAIEHSRFDLNGDGYTGGSTRDRFDLDMEYPQLFQGSSLYASPVSYFGFASGFLPEFDERMVTDLDILCYYANSPIYEGSQFTRLALLNEYRCMDLRLAPIVDTLRVMEIHPLTVEAKNVAGDFVPLTSENFYGWSLEAPHFVSSDPATVDVGIYAYASSAGSATITATGLVDIDSMVVTVRNSTPAERIAFSWPVTLKGCSYVYTETGQYLSQGPGISGSNEVIPGVVGSRFVLSEGFPNQYCAFGGSVVLKGTAPPLVNDFALVPIVPVGAGLARLAVGDSTTMFGFPGQIGFQINSASVTNFTVQRSETNQDTSVEGCGYPGWLGDGTYKKWTMHGTAYRFSDWVSIDGALMHSRAEDTAPVCTEWKN